MVLAMYFTHEHINATNLIVPNTALATHLSSLYVAICGNSINVLILCMLMYTITYTAMYVRKFNSLTVLPTLDHQFIYSSGTTGRWWESIASSNLLYILHKVSM